MEIPVKLLANGVDQDRILVFGKLIHSFRPKRNGEADQQHGFDQDDGKFQMSGDAAVTPS